MIWIYKGTKYHVGIHGKTDNFIADQRNNTLVFHYLIEGYENRLNRMQKVYARLMGQCTADNVLRNVYKFLDIVLTVFFNINRFMNYHFCSTGHQV
jgi:hypothetical protein